MGGTTLTLPWGRSAVLRVIDFSTSPVARNFFLVVSGSSGRTCSVSGRSLRDGLWQKTKAMARRMVVARPEIRDFANKPKTQDLSRN